MLQLWLPGAAGERSPRSACKDMTRVLIAARHRERRPRNSAILSGWYKLPVSSTPVARCLFHSRLQVLWLNFERTPLGRYGFGEGEIII
jgi:hypothetical protein